MRIIEDNLVKETEKKIKRLLQRLFAKNRTTGRELACPQSRSLIEAIILSL